MTDREWFRRFEQEAHAAGDGDRLRLVGLLFDADLHRETNPDRMLALLDEGRRLAERLGEAWWVLVFDDRRAGALMKYKGDVQAGLELAVRNTLELRKPSFDQFPCRFRVHDHLIVGYLNTDPVGYAAEVLTALDWLAGEVGEGHTPVGYLLLARRRWLASEMGDLEAAEAYARQGLALAENDPDQLTARSHAVFCFSHLCEIAHMRQDYQALSELAPEGESLARQVALQLEQGEFLMWQAGLARHVGREAQAQALAGRALRRVAQLGMPPDHIWFDAVCAFHQQAEHFEEALAVRERELTLITGRGRWAAEIRCRIQRCALLLRLQRSPGEELQQARRVAHQLRRPAEVLARLDALEAEGSG